MSDLKLSFIGSAAGVALMVAAGPALAQSSLTTVQSVHSVDDTVERLSDAAEEGGANVFAVIDHAAGAESIDETLPPMKVIILGDPEMGTPLLQESPSIGIDLPVRILVWEDENGDVQLGYIDPETLADTHGIDRDHPAIDRMATALSNLAEVAGDNEDDD